MAITESWFKQDLKKRVIQQYIVGNFFSLDNMGNLVGVKVYDNGAEAILSGSVTGYCALADGTTVPVSGTRSGNQAYILLPQSVLSITGPIGIVLKLTDGNTITTLLSIIATVYPSQTDEVVTPSQQVITDWAQQINAALQNVVDASAAQDQKIADLKSAFDNMVEQPGTVSGGMGQSFSAVDGQMITNLKVFAHTEYSSLSPTISNPATYENAASSTPRIFLTKGLDHGISQISLDRLTTRTNTTILRNLLTAGRHSFTANLQHNMTDGGGVFFILRDASDATVGQFGFDITKSGSLTALFTTTATATKLYTYISNSATSGSATISDIIIDGVLPLSADTLYSLPVESGGNYVFNGESHLCDYYDFSQEKIFGLVSIRHASQNDNFSALNTIDGNTLYQLASDYTSQLLLKRQKNYFITHFTPETTGYRSGNIGVYFWDGSFRFRVSQSQFPNADTFETWAINNSMDIVLPRNEVRETAIPSNVLLLFNNIIQYKALENIYCTEDVGIEVEFAKSDWIDNGTILSGGVVTPEAFGAVGNGVTDDTYAIQAAINAAQKSSGTVLCSGSAVYAISTLQISDRLNIDGNGCTFKAIGTDAVFKVYRTTNAPNGSIHDLTIDMDHMALCGILVSHDWRGQYHNLTINNPATNGVGISVLYGAGGCLFDSINGRDAIGSITHGTTFMRIIAADASYTNIDWQNYCVGIDVSGAATFNNIHGYIASSALFEESVFMRISARVSIVNAYPDSQKKFFEICSDHAVSIIGGFSWYNNDSIDYGNLTQGYAIYSDDNNYLENVCVYGFNFSQPSDGAKPYILTNAETSPGLIGCWQEGVIVVDDESEDDPGEHVSSKRRIPNSW